MSFSETTVDDLHCAGITPEFIKAQMENRISPIEGQIVGYFLPENGWNLDSRVRRALNIVKNDCPHTVGTVGIEVNDGTAGENTLYYFYNIESVFSNVTQPDDNTKDIIPASADPSAVPLEATDDFGITFLKESTDDLPDVAIVGQRLKMTIQFYGVKPEVPSERRQPITRQFWGRLRMSPIPFTRPLPNPTFGPENRFATITINYDTDRIGKEKLKAEITKLANTQKWEGKVKISFI